MNKSKINKFNNGYSPMNYVGNIASGASAGMSIGGPIGAIIGGGVGLWSSINQDKEYQKSIMQERAIAQQSKNNLLSTMIRQSYNLNNIDNTGIPGFNKGVAGFTPNAITGVNSFVSKGEVIRDNMSGSLIKVPGKYNKKSVDTVPANLASGDSVYSADPMQALPFGKSTPAKIADKIRKVNESAAKGGRIDKATAELMNKELEKLDMYTWLMNNAENPVGMYSGGKSKFSDADIQKEMSKYKGSIVNYLSTKGFAFDKKNRAKLAKDYGIVLDESGYKADADHNTKLLRALISEDLGVTSAAKSQAAQTQEADAVSVQPIQQPIQTAPSNNTIPANDAMLHDEIEFQNEENTSSPLKEIGTDKFYSDFYGEKNKIDWKSIGASAGNVLSGISAISPALVNIFSRPETVTPVYDQYIAPRSSYSLSAPLADISRQSRIARYNQSIVGGAGLQYGAAIHGQALASTAGLFDKAAMFNAESANRYSAVANEAMARNSAETRRVQDLNMRSRAASSTATKTALSQLSQYSQQKQLEKNMMQRDAQGFMMWAQASGANFTPEQMDNYFKTYGYRPTKR